MTATSPPPYRLLITASRTWENRSLINRVLAGVLAEHPGAVLVSGHCPKGGDRIGEECWAALSGHAGVWEAIDAGRIEVHPIERYRRYGRGAGQTRNKAMVQTGPDECVAFLMPCRGRTCNIPGVHDSHGTTGCHDFAVAAGIPTRPFRQGNWA